jgi:NADP-dependent aldehyde dehydrogenase
MSSVTGSHYIAGQARPSDSLTGEDFRSFDPVGDEAFGPSFRDASSAWIDEAAKAAESAAEAFRRSSRETRARLLEAVAEGIETLGDELIETASRETALPIGRITGERGRTVGQLRRFANTVREGSYLGLRIDPAQPDRAPIPRADLRQMKLAIGPVAVFGASNFPLAFSVAGGDTAAALAAGCPVLVKGHPGHPATSELVARAITEAVAKLELPAGIFSLVHGRGVEVGGGLAKHPAVQAVAFTGSLRGGRALFDMAAARPQPIPVYAEMGSVNPVLLLPGALSERGRGLAEGLANSLTMGVGQFCTNPGLVVALTGDDASYSAFANALREQVGAKPAGTMLHPGIAASYSAELGRRRSHAALQGEGRGGSGSAAQAQHAAQAAFFEIDALRLADAPELLEEHFGPSTLVVRARSTEEACEVIARVEGQLTATVHGTDTELEGADAGLHGLLDALETKAGRVLFGGMPTGVEVCDAMVHGGPYPATTAVATTSVGTAAIDRFVRPLCWQNAPQSRLPVELRDENPDGLLRLIDGKWSSEAL